MTAFDQIHKTGTIHVEGFGEVPLTQKQLADLRLLEAEMRAAVWRAAAQALLRNKRA